MNGPPAWLLLRRHGGLWGIRQNALGKLRREPGGSPGIGAGTSRVELRRGGTLAADEILAMTRQLDERPLPRCARRWCEASVGGLAVWRRQPVVLLDLSAPLPACLGYHQETAETNGDGDRL